MFSFYTRRLSASRKKTWFIGGPNLQWYILFREKAGKAQIACMLDGLKRKRIVFTPASIRTRRSMERLRQRRVLRRLKVMWQLTEK